MKLINTENYNSRLKIGFVNCTSVSSIGSIYKKICIELKIRISASPSEKECLEAIEKYLSKKHQMTLLVLDEIDQLCGTGKKQNDILYHIFEWPSIEHSKLILVGIANALDLTDRSLKRLQLNVQLKPTVMHFSAYTKAQIYDIFKTRLEESGTDLFPSAAINLLAAKVSAVSGDIRRALNIGKRVIEIAEMERSKNSKKKLDITKLEAVIDSENNSNEIDEKPMKIEMKEVVSVLNNVYGNSQKLADDVDEAFPLLQKILLCTLMLIVKFDKRKIITIAHLNDIYKKVCKNRNINSIDFCEFTNICNLVETRGIIKIVRKKEPRFHQIQLQWDEDEIISQLKDKQMIENILSEKSLLR
jgi:cell division control protein 6